jgi:signal transduction histidine kinase
MLPPPRELEFLKLLDALGQYVRSTREPRKALTFALKEGRAFFRADSGCVAMAETGERDTQLLLALPRSDAWDLEHLGRFIRHARPPVRPDLVLAPIRRRGAAWGVMAFRRSSAPFDHDEGRRLARITAVVSAAIQAMDRERMFEVRDRIDRRIMELLDPKDLFYQILDGLRSLTHYDHSSALLIRERGEDSLRVVAEQIAWTKARSRHIGLILPLDAEIEPMLTSAEIHGFDRAGDEWRAWGGKPVAPLARLLDYNRDGHAGAPAREASMLCAPLVARDGMIGILKVASRHPGRLKPFDAELVDRFRSQAAVAIQNLTRTESLQARMLTAERKHAIADLARTVSHDVNNALGAMLPLIQQMHADLQAGRMDTAIYLDDLDQVQKSVQACRRIFGGMLSFARGGARRSHHGEVSPALDTTLAVLKDGMERRGIELVIETVDDLPPVACGQSDLEQVFLNLLTNAREASSQGDVVTVRIEPAPERIAITVADRGCGIAPENLARVFEPFFTTKANGNGLGLSICRSILWEVGGTLNLHSEPRKGTRVHVTVPWAPASIVDPPDL